MSEKPIIIREDFRNLIPPLSEDEKNRLHIALDLDQKALHPLIVWRQTGILLDGHHRYDYCTKAGLPYTVNYRSFEDEDSAKAFMIDLQLARRNLDPTQRKILVGRIYNARKKTKSEAGAIGGASQANATVSLASTTAATVAAEHNVSPRTVASAGKLAKAVETLGIEADVMSGKDKRTEKEILRDAEEAAGRNGAPAEPKKPKHTPGLHEQVVNACYRLVASFVKKGHDEKKVKAIIQSVF